MTEQECIAIETLTKTQVARELLNQALMATDFNSERRAVLWSIMVRLDIAILEMQPDVPTEEIACECP